MERRFKFCRAMTVEKSLIVLVIEAAPNEETGMLRELEPWEVRCRQEQFALITHGMTFLQGADPEVSELHDELALLLSADAGLFELDAGVVVGTDGADLPTARIVRV